MQSSLKKSLYLGLAALSFGAVAATTTNASAKTYAKAGSYSKLTTPAADRNVNVTGSNALYTKPGTVKGAKVVATKTTMKNLSNSQSGKANFRAYGVKTTNRGSVYYKVVSFDKAYRGYVYAGKTKGTFAGGLTPYTTFKTGTLNDSQKTGVYKITNAGAKTPVYSEPAYTQYKIGRSLLDTSAYKDATFNIDKIGTTTRENDVWVHIVNTTASDTKANGWILQSKLTSTNDIAKDTVRVNLVGNDGANLGYVDYTKDGAALGDTLGQLTDTKNNGNYTWNLDNLDGQGEELRNKVNDKLKGTGYALASGKFTQSQVAALAQAKTGSAVTLQLAKGNTVYTQFVPNSRSASQSTEAAVKMTALDKTNNLYGGLVNLTVTELTDNNGNTVTLNDTLKGLNLSDAYSTDATTLKNLSEAVKTVANTKEGATDLANYNKAIALSAAVLYNAPQNLKVTDLFSGAYGANFTADQALAYLKGNSQLNSLKSAVYPQYDAQGNITYKQLTFTPQSADAGAFGDLSKAVFTYDLASAKNVAKPAAGSAAKGDETVNPLLPGGDATGVNSTNVNAGTTK